MWCLAFSVFPLNLITSYLGTMTSANIKIKPFDGSGDISEWLNKFQLIVKLRSIDNEASILPMFLEGSALSLYLELT